MTVSVQYNWKQTNHIRLGGLMMYDLYDYIQSNIIGSKSVISDWVGAGDLMMLGLLARPTQHNNTIWHHIMTMLIGSTVRHHSRREQYINPSHD